VDVPADRRAVPTVQIDDALVRVTEWRFAPGAATGWHRHEHPYVVVPMTTGSLALTGPEGETLADLVAGQDFKLLPRRTVEDNVALALQVTGTPPRETRARVFAILKQLGLQHRRYHHPLSLSGGEQQRVAIARALVNEPEILLADEPTGNLDPELTIEIMDLIASAALRGTTVVVATHELEIVRRYGKRAVRLEAGCVTEDSLTGRVHA